jgi:hypothetical protein
MGGNRERDIPLCEIKFRSKDTALLIRKEFAKKRKEELTSEGSVSSTV